MTITNLTDNELQQAKRIAELEAEIVGWKADQRENLSNQCDLQAEINALRAQIETVQRDAERYVWWVEIIESGELEILEKAFEPLGDADSVTKQDMDAAIDAAMKGAA
jgi:chromosome segregation ATPase